MAVIVTTAAVSAMAAITQTAAAALERQDTATWEGEVVITERADFNCGYCAAFAAIMLPKLRENFLNDGEAKFEFKHFPFLHGSSWDAALAYECAAEQRHGARYHDWLFNEHGKRSGPDFSLENLSRLADDTGLDVEEFNTCLDSERHLGKVESDRATGLKAGVAGTPALFINGSRAEYRDYEDLHRQIAEEVGKRGAHIEP